MEYLTIRLTIAAEVEEVNCAAFLQRIAEEADDRGCRQGPLEA
jgi:hypothetical protein